MKILDYLYLGLYRVLLKTSDRDIAQYSALILFTLEIIFFVAIVIAIFSFRPSTTWAKSVNYFICVFLGGCNYFLFLRRDRYKVIYEKHLKKPKSFQRLSSVISLTFLIGGIPALVIIKYIMTH